MRIQSYCTQATQGVVAFCPLGKLLFYGCNKGAKGREILVVGAKFSSEFPDPLNRAMLVLVWLVPVAHFRKLFYGPEFCRAFENSRTSRVTL